MPACAQGISNTGVSQRLGVTLQTVGKVASVLYRSAPGRTARRAASWTTAKISDAKGEEVLTMAAGQSHGKAMHWSTRLIATGSGTILYTNLTTR